MPLPTTRAVLPALTRFHFTGLFEYFEDFVAQIDAPQLDRLGIGYLDPSAEFQIPQLCKFIVRSEKLRLSLFMHADLSIIHMPRTTVIELWGQSFFYTFHAGRRDESGAQPNCWLLSDVDRLSIGSGFTGNSRLGSSIQWLEILRPLTSVRSLSVKARLSQRVANALNNVTGAEAAEVLPALQSLCLENQKISSVGKFVVARQNGGHPVTFINKVSE
jgi:hypothetical protein